MQLGVHLWEVSISGGSTVHVKSITVLSIKDVTVSASLWDQQHNELGILLLLVTE